MTWHMLLEMIISIMISSARGIESSRAGLPVSVVCRYIPVQYIQMKKVGSRAEEDAVRSSSASCFGQLVENVVPGYGARSVKVAFERIVVVG